MSKESALAQATGTPAPALDASTAPKDQVLDASTTPNTTSSDPNVQALLKKEVRLVKEQEAFKLKQREWEEKVKRADALLERDRQFDETKKKDSFAALKMLGFTDTEIVNGLAAATPSEKTAEETAEEIARRVLKENNDALDVKAKEAEAKKNVEVIDRFQKSIGSMIDANPDKYEFCKFNGSAAQELIYETVAETLKDSGKLLTVSEATDLVEKYYEDRSAEMTKLKKLTPKEAVTEVKAEPKRETVVHPKIDDNKPRPTKTLTNRVAPTVTTGQRSESPSEKRERLAQVLRSGDTSLLRR